MGFKVGDLVMIHKDSAYYGSHHELNPADVVGVISSVDDDSIDGRYWVKWHGEFQNVYGTRHLILSSNIEYGTLRNFKFR